MSFRALLVTKAAVCLTFGAFLLAAPAVLFDLLGGSLTGAGLFTAREYGAAMIGTLLLTWFGRHIKAPDARAAILLNLLVYDAIGMVITLAVVRTGVLNALGWGIVAVYAFFTIASGHVLWREKSVATGSAA